MPKKRTGVYPYETKGGERWRWKAEVGGRSGGRKGFLREKDAAEARAVWVAEQLQGIGLTGGRGKTVRDFGLNDWLPRLHAKVVRGELRSSTVAQYERDLRNHLLPEFGSRRLGDVGVEDAERFGDRLSARGLSPDTVRRIQITLGQVYKLAVKWRLVAFNPVRDAEKPRPRPFKPELPTLGQIVSLGACAPSVNTRGLILFAAYAGVRKSEAFGLRWENVDLTEGSERVWIVEQHYKGETVQMTKTSAGLREEVIGPQAAGVLRELSVAQQLDERPNPLGLVFPSPMGRYWLDTNFDRRVWQRTCVKAGLPKMKFKTLRSFFVSHVRAQGLPTAITEQLTGHVDERTHRAYTQPIPGTEPLIRAALGRAFSQGEGQ